MKYHSGESEKVIRKATYAVVASNEANVGGRQSTELECLRASAKNDRELVSHLIKYKPNSMSQGRLKTASANNNLARELERIVAKRSFFLNPHRNDPKIIKTKHRLYVI